MCVHCISHSYTLFPKTVIFNYEYFGYVYYFNRHMFFMLWDKTLSRTVVSARHDKTQVPCAEFGSESDLTGLSIPSDDGFTCPLCSPLIFVKSPGSFLSFDSRHPMSTLWKRYIPTKYTVLVSKLIINFFWSSYWINNQVNLLYSVSTLVAQ